MASRSLGTLTIDLIARVGGFVSGMDEAERRADKAAKKMRKELAASLDATYTALGTVGTAAIAAGAALGTLAVSSVKATAEQIDLARTIGATQAELAGLTRAAELSGTSAEELATAAKKMNNTIGEAQAGSTSAVDALARLGLTAQELAALPVSERMQVIAESISGLTTQTERAAAAQDIFGKGGQVLLPLLEDGAAAFEAGAKEARDFGLALNQVDAAAVAEADDKINSLMAAMDGLKTQFGAAMAPIISQFADELLRGGTNAETFRDKFVGAFYASSKAAAFLGDIVQSITLPFRALHVLAKSIQVDFIGIAKAGTAFGLLLKPKNAGLLKDMQTITGDFNRAYKELGEATAGLVDTALGSYMDDVDEFFARVRQRVAEQAVTPPPKPEGGTDPLASEAEKKAEEAARKAAEQARKAKDKELRDSIARLDEQFQTEEQKLGVKYVNEQKMLEEALANKAVTEDEYQRLRLESQKAYESELDKLRFGKMDEGVQALRDSFQSDQQKLGTKYVEEQKLLQEALESKRITQDEYDQLALESLTAYESEVTRIQTEEADKRIKKAEEERQSKLNAFKGFFGNLSTLMNSESRKAFEIGKAAALAGAIVDGIAATIGAYKTGAKIGGPVLGAAFAAAAAAATMVQIQQIRAQKFGGGGNVSSPGGAGVSNTQAINNATEPVQNKALQNMTILLSGSSRFTAEEVAGLMEQVGERLSDSGGRMGKVTVMTV